MHEESTYGGLAQERDMHGVSTSGDLWRNPSSSVDFLRRLALLVTTHPFYLHFHCLSLSYLKSFPAKHNLLHSPKPTPLHIAQRLGLEAVGRHGGRGATQQHIELCLDTIHTGERCCTHTRVSYDSSYTNLFKLTFLSILLSRCIGYLVCP